MIIRTSDQLLSAVFQRPINPRTAAVLRSDLSSDRPDLLLHGCALSASAAALLLDLSRK